MIKDERIAAWGSPESMESKCLEMRQAVYHYPGKQEKGERGEEPFLNQCPVASEFFFIDL